MYSTMPYIHTRLDSRTEPKFFDCICFMGSGHFACRQQKPSFGDHLH